MKGNHKTLLYVLSVPAAVFLLAMLTAVLAEDEVQEPGMVLAEESSPAETDVQGSVPANPFDNSKVPVSETVIVTSDDDLTYWTFDKSELPMDITNMEQVQNLTPVGGEEYEQVKSAVEQKIAQESGEEYTVSYINYGINGAKDASLVDEVGYILPESINVNVNVIRGEQKLIRLDYEGIPADQSQSAVSSGHSAVAVPADATEVFVGKVGSYLSMKDGQYVLYKPESDAFWYPIVDGVVTVKMADAAQQSHGTPVTFIDADTKTIVSHAWYLASTTMDEREKIYSTADGYNDWQNKICNDLLNLIPDGYEAVMLDAQPFDSSKYQFGGEMGYFLPVRLAQTAAVNGKTYATLQEAIAAAKDSDAVIDVLTLPSRPVNLTTADLPDKEVLLQLAETVPFDQFKDIVSVPEGFHMIVKEMARRAASGPAGTLVSIHPSKAAAGAVLKAPTALEDGLLEEICDFCQTRTGTKVLPKLVSDEIPAEGFMLEIGEPAEADAAAREEIGSGEVHTASFTGYGLFGTLMTFSGSGFAGLFRRKKQK